MDNLQKISYWKNKVYDVGFVQVIDVSLSGLSSVTGNDYVGGNAGGCGWANQSGLISENNKIKGNSYGRINSVYTIG